MAARRVPVELVAGGALLGSYALVRRGGVGRLDAAATRACSRPRGASVDRVVGATTDLGSVYGLAGVATALAVGGRRTTATQVALAGALAWCAAQASKPLLPRERPYEQAGAARLVAIPAGTSWPSGHAAVAASMATVVAPRLRPAAVGAVVAATAGVAWSRLYVGVHHLSDVVAGLGVGVLCAAAVRRGWDAVPSGSQRPRTSRRR